MRYQKLIVLCIFIYLPTFHLKAQLPFGIPDEICPATVQTFTSPDPSAPIHRWDFCTGDLLETPLVNAISSEILGTARPEGMDIVFDGTNWYGFITSRSNNSIIRANFGNDINNIPTYTNLGNPDNALSAPIGISVMKDNSGWYAFIANISPTPTGKITRINFGVNLNNSSPSTNTFIFSDMEYPEVVETAYDNGNFLLIVGCWVSDTHIINFGTSFGNNSPSSINKNLPGINGTRIVRVVQEGNNWYGIGACPFAGPSSNQNHIHFLNFGTSLFNAPSITQFTSNVDINMSNAGLLYDLRLAYDGNQAIAFLMTTTRLIRLNFGSSFNNLFPTTEDLGNFGQINQDFPRGPTLCFDIVKDNSQYFLFSVNRTVNGFPDELARFNFPESNCVAETVYSEIINPSNSYLVSGNMVASLETFDDNLNPIEYYVDDFIVKDETIGDFIAYNQCLGETTFFQNNSIGSDASVTSWEWDFGDGSSLSTEKEPQHIYTNPGIYTTKLKVVNFSGCENEIEKQIKIIEYPQADFEINVPRCINQEIIFENTSMISPVSQTDPNAFFTSYWDYGDVPPDGFSPTGLNDGNYTYTSVGIYPVTLSVNDFYNVLPSLFCSGTTTQDVTVGEFPIADFSNTLACVNAPTEFSDLSTITGSVGNQITDWSWDFAGIESSNLRNPSFTFTSAGIYTVSLTVKSICDCEDSFSKEIEVLSSTESIFTSSITQGAASLTVEFTNQSIGADSYFWDFGDGNTSNEESPTYTFDTPGIYTVSFQAKNSLGCGTLATETITVLDPGTDISLNNLGVNDNNGIAEISVEIKNENTSTISELLLDLDLGNTETVQEIWTGELLANETLTYTFLKNLSSSALSELTYICAEGLVQGVAEDINIFNNTTCYIISEEFDFINLSPNPARNDITLEYYIPDTNTNLELDIIDELGKVIANKEIISQRKGVNAKVYNISSLANGVYHIRLSYGGVSKTKKVLIVK